MVKVQDEEFLPCDLLLLNTPDPKGMCYIETKNLDGETNLKNKNVHKDILGRFRHYDDYFNLEGHILCEKPNNAIYKFEGQLAIAKRQDKIPLNAENIVLRGSSIRNTEFIEGICVFSGHDTKVMQNSSSAKYKFSQLEIQMNKSLLYIFSLQAFLALLAAILGTVWTQGHETTTTYL